MPDRYFEGVGLGLSDVFVDAADGFDAGVSLGDLTPADSSTPPQQGH
jgi:hypothetical protein